MEEPIIHCKMLTEKLCLSLGFKCEINVDNPQHSWSQALKKNRKKKKNYNTDYFLITS